MTIGHRVARIDINDADGIADPIAVDVHRNFTNDDPDAIKAGLGEGGGEAVRGTVPRAAWDALVKAITIGATTADKLPPEKVGR